jgi:hypothetical protein
VSEQVKQVFITFKYKQKGVSDTVQIVDPRDFCQKPWIFSSFSTQYNALVSVSSSFMPQV